MPKIYLDLGEPKVAIVDARFKTKYNERPGHVFDFSILNTFLGCHRAYFYRHESNLSVLGSTATPLVMGGGMHQALEAHHKILQANGTGEFDYEVNVRAAKLAYIDKIKPHIVSGAFPLTMEHSDGKRYATRGLAIIEEYLKYYPREDFTVEGTELPVAIIIPYKYLHEEGEIVYIGMVDALVLWRGQYYILETKTTSRIDRFYFPSFKLSYQVTGYIYIMREIKGLPISRAIINAVGIYKDQYKFERDRTHRTNEELDSFREQILSITREIFWYRQRIEQGEDPENVFYQNPANCFKWNRACQFHPLCTKPTSAGRQQIKDVMYMKDVWSPFEIYGAELEPPVQKEGTITL